MQVRKCRIPVTSEFGANPDQFYYWDSFEAGLSRTELPIHEIYLGIFAHHPWWAKMLLVARTKIGSLFGLKGPTFADFNHPGIKEEYKVGDKIGRFTLFSQNENEIITGGNDRHMDFRVSVLKVNEDGVSRLVLSTIVSPHNIFGKAYMFLIGPFHRFGVRMILSNAAAAKRV